MASSCDKGRIWDRAPCSWRACEPPANGNAGTLPARQLRVYTLEEKLGIAANRAKRIARRSRCWPMREVRRCATSSLSYPHTHRAKRCCCSQTSSGCQSGADTDPHGLAANAGGAELRNNLEGLTEAFVLLKSRTLLPCRPVTAGCNLPPCPIFPSHQKKRYSWCAAVGSTPAVCVSSSA